MLPMITALQLNPTIVIGGEQIINGSVVVEQPVPLAVDVELDSSDDEVATPSPSRVTIAPNTTTRSFRIGTGAVEFSMRPNIRAFYAGVESLVEGESQRTRTITVRPLPRDLPPDLPFEPHPL